MSEYKSYKDKQQFLGECFEKVSPREFYADIFDPADMERRGCPEDGKANPIIAITYRKGEKKYMRNELVFADLDAIDNAKGNEFAICSLCSYSGRRRTAKNAYKLHGIAIDLDGVGKREIETFYMGVNLKILPTPTYVVNSGHGIHVYYIFENPVPLYPKLITWLQRLKTGLTYAVWTRETSTYKPAERQFQGIYQGFRMPGSCSKIGKGKARTKYPVTAYRWWRKVSIEYLNGFVEEKYRMPVMPDYSSYEWADEEHLTLEEAKEKYPAWYEKRIVRGEKPGRWTANEGLYYWWLNKIQETGNARDGNRYNCIAVLFIMGVKCLIGKDYVLEDALGLVPMLNELTIRPDNEFTEDDVLHASKYYADQYVYYSINAIEARTGIKIKRRKPKEELIYTNKDDQLEYARLRKSQKKRRGEMNAEGRPAKAAQVQAYRAEHPDANVSEVAKALGISRTTVYKWWDAN